MLIMEVDMKSGSQGPQLISTYWERSWGTNKLVNHHDPSVEAEENLISHKPLGCLLSQCPLSRGDIVLQLLGFGVSGLARR